MEGKQIHKSNILNVNIKNYTECGWCLDKTNTEILNIPWAIWSQWLFISQRMGKKEWGAVFWIKDNTIFDFRIPRQEVSSVDCEFKEELGGDGIVHSHHDMGAFHSSQDDAHARNLYEYSIVLANSDGYTATKRIKLPCHGFGYIKVQLQIVELPAIEFPKISERARELISEESYGYPQQEPPCDECLTQSCEDCQFMDAGCVSCENCDTFKCKTCKLTIGLDMSETLPFCSFCRDYSICASCARLAKYLENYPQDKEKFRK
jgi:hypothetical protein